jgi:linoleoyl-CoA desaturase
MYVKTVVVLSWLAASYALLVFFATTWWLALPLAISLGLSMAAVGFNIQHDGGHRAFSKHQWINRLMATSLDLLGAIKGTFHISCRNVECPLCQPRVPVPP